ncbi:hypothetical protein AVEN_82106-1 [Araneus ventricosus]|uniref:Uncharacterized protein n=1 Tax=Araneus ventricosus TaxID=182803 RepID=A0A4Y2TA22_ARAVE|nr:hypothetical protein AVEN_82106-1 [Araneus ventricosus]
MNNLKCELPPTCRSVWDHSNNDRSNSSDTEVGVLTAVIGQCLAPSEGGAELWVRGYFIHTIIVSPGEARTRLLIRRLLIHGLLSPSTTGRVIKWIRFHFKNEMRIGFDLCR